MVYQADGLWWHPHIKVYTSCVEGDASALRKHATWLLDLVAKFKPPSDESRSALEKNTHLEVSGKKAAIEERLRGPVLQVSQHLSLDQVQSFFLFKRWWKDEGRGTAPERLGASDLIKVTEYYFAERLHLLKTAEEVLIRAQEESETKEILKDIIQQGFESNLFSILEDASRGEGNGALPMAPASRRQAESGVMPQALVKQEGKLWALQAALERCLALNIAVLLYNFRPALCTASRWAGLARVAPLLCSHAGLMAGDDPELVALARRAAQLCSVLLIEGLDMEGLLWCLALSGDDACPSHHLSNQEALETIEAAAKELCSRRNPPASVALAWSAFQVLQSSAGVELGEPSLAAASACGEWAWNTGCMDEMLQFVEGDGVGKDSSLSGLYKTVLLHAFVAVIGAFDISPQTLGTAELQTVIRLLDGLLAEQTEACEAFWESLEESVEDEAKTPDALAPLMTFLNSARDIFPAAPLPLLLTLKALSQGENASVHAYLYLKNLPSLAMLHEPEQFLGVSVSSPGSCVFSDPGLKLPWGGLTLPEGVQGLVTALPPILSAQSPLLAPLWEQSNRDRVLVRWQGCAPGQIAVMMLARHALHCLSNPSLPAASVRGASQLLSGALHLLAQLLESDPAVARDCLAWSWDLASEPSGDLSKPDVIALLNNALRNLFSQPGATPEDLSSCFKIAKALAAHLSGQVLECLRAAHLLGTDETRHGRGFEPSGVPNMRVFQERFESPLGKYPASLAYIELLESLVRKQVGQGALLGMLSHAVHAVMARHASWQYVHRAERWRISRACLRAARAVLQVGGLRPTDDCLVQLLVHTFAQDGAFHALLLNAMPAGARALEATARQGINVEPAEGAAEELLLLLPPLFEALERYRGDCISICRELFRAPPGNPSLLPAEIISSYLEYRSPRIVLACLGAVSAVGRHGARVAENMSFAAILNQGRGADFSRLRAVLAQHFALQTARSDAGLFCAVTGLLEVAVRHHPSLLDVLLSPPPELPDDAKGGAPDVGGGSCFRNFVELLLEGRGLLDSEPRSVAAVLALLTELLQCGNRSRRVAEVLRSQPGIWKAVAGCVVCESPGSGGGGASEEGRCPDGAAAWRFLAVAWAAEALTMELYGSMGDVQAGGEEGVSAALRAWVGASGPDHVSKAIGFCSGVPSGAIGELAKEARRHARAASLELLASSLQQGSCFLGPPLLEALVSGSDWVQETLRARGLGPEALAQLASDISEGTSPAEVGGSRGALLAESGTWPSTLEDALLSYAAVTSAATPPPDPMEREVAATAPDSLSPYGGLSPRHVDAGALEAALGPHLVQEMPSVQELLGCLRRIEALSAEASAALAALRALRALSTVSGACSADGAASLRLGRPTEHMCALLKRCMAPLVGRPPAERPGAILPSGAEHCCMAAVELSALVLAGLQRDGKSIAEEEQLEWCTELVTLLVGWLQTSITGLSDHMQGSLASPQHQLTTNLTGAVLQLLRMPWKKTRKEAAKDRSLQNGARALLPLLVNLQQRMPSLTPTTSALVEVMLAEFVPHYEGIQLLEQATSDLLAPLFKWSWDEPALKASSWEEVNASLRLAVRFAQSREGSLVLHNNGALSCCVSRAMWLLSREGGALGYAEEEQLPNPAGASHPQGEQVDVLRAYDGSSESAIHRMWLSVLALQGTVLRQLAAVPGHEAVPHAITFVTAAETRMLAALEPPSGLPSQPLTLAGAREAAAVAFLLCQMAPLLGPWQLARQSGPISFRRAAVAFLEFATAPGAAAMGDVVCTPVTQAERAMASADSPLPSDSGWLQAVTRTSAGTKADGERPPGRAPRPQATPTLFCSTRKGCASRFAAEVASSLYAAVQHCLTFLAAVSPSVTPEEADSLSGEWPPLDLLSELCCQLIEVGRSLSTASEGAAELDRLRRTVGRSMLACLRLQAMQGADLDPDRESVAQLLREMAGAGVAE